MKKYLLLLFFPISIFAQDNFSLLNKNSMETSVLYDRAFKVADILDYSKKINSSYFIQAYSELSHSDYGNNFENIDILKNAWKDGFRENYIPIAILHTKFDILKTNAFDDGLVALDAENKLISNVSNDVSLYETRKRTIVSPVTNKVKGLQNVFKILPELITNTTQNSITQIRADFNNGLGFRNVNLNENIIVNYNSEGEKRIDFEITFSDGTTTQNSAYFLITLSRSEQNALAPGDEGPITPINATIPYQGFGEASGHIGTAEYKIFFDNVDGVLDKPIFFVDGFDPGDGRTIPLIYDLLNFGNSTENLGNLVRDEGFDIVILNFPTYTSSTDGVTIIDGGADFIQRNAFILVELINTINAMKVGSEQNVVIGPSMGGLISRYALRYMEQNALDHDTRLYLSFDSPHLGANVAMGIQYLFNFMVNGDPDITALEPLVNGLLNSAAAKQMLVDHYLAHLDTVINDGFTQDTNLTTPIGAPNFRDAFQSELDVMGFPQNTRNVSMINGSGIGTTTGSPGMTLLDNEIFDTGVVGGLATRARVDLRFTPDSGLGNTVSSIIGEFFLFSWLEAFSFSADADSPALFNFALDSAPGGQFNLGSFDDGTNPLITDFVNALAIDRFNFIPAVSGMALDVSANGEIDWYFDIDLGAGSPPNGDVINTTPFVNWYIPDANENHVLLTQANVDFALSEIIPEILSVNTNEEFNFRIEQNPITNTLTILNDSSINNASIEIIDLTGKAVYKLENVSLTNRTSFPIDLSSGLYILNINSTENFSFKAKLIVK